MTIGKLLVRAVFAALLFIPSAVLADTPPVSGADTATVGLSKQAPAASPEQKPAVTEAKPSPAPTGAAAADTAQAPDALSNPSAEFLKSDDTELVEEDDGPDTPGATAADAAESDALRMAAASGDSANPLEKNIRYFSVTVKNHFSRWLSRSGKYMDLMKSILRENYLPEDLVFLALIESGFNPKARSWARASGPWQFIRGTAVRYGLKVDRWVDERRDPIKSTRAAAAYLKDLYGMFGTWPLAMASYNAGEGNVARAVNRNNTLDFWELRKTRSLPSETKEYVPKFMAAQMIANHPGEYGFDDVEYEQPFEFDEVSMDRCTDLELVAKCCGVSVDDINELNPELIRGCTPPNQQGYVLRIPKGAKETFLKAYDALPEGEKVAHPRPDKVRRYLVRRNDSIKNVARRLHVSAAALAEANDLTADSRVRKGRRLVVPSDGGARLASRHGKGGARTVKVRRGDTLARIAKRQEMSVSTLAKLNGLDPGAKLRHGQRLVVSAGGSKSAHASKKTYKVRNGDTLSSISKRFRVSREALLRANAIDDGTSIKAGQKLVIPAEEEAA